MKSCSEQELSQWFDPLRLCFSESEKRVLVHFPHAFFSDCFFRQLGEKFEESLHNLFGSGNILEYRSPSNRNGAELKSSKDCVKKIDYPFGHKYTFENFIVNRKNQFPLSSAKEISNKHDVVFNPFIICGPNACGKTHLLKAIANQLSKNYELDNIFFGSIEDINNIYEINFKGDKTKSRLKIMSFGITIIDDFHLIVNNSNLLNEFIILFNHYYEKNKQIILSLSDSFINSNTVDNKILSYLNGGLRVDLKSPDIDVRIKFIQNKCKVKKIPLNQKQILTIAQIFTDFRSIQGILLKLFAFKKLVRRDLKESDFEQILNIAKGHTTKTIDKKTILNAVSEHFKISLKDIIGEKRSKDIVLSRQVAMFLCREILGCSFPTLGKIFGGKDHSTAMYAVKKIQKLQKDDERMKTLLTSLRMKCSSFDTN